MISHSNLWKAIAPLCCLLLLDAMTYGLVMPALGPMLLNIHESILPINTPLHIRNILYGIVLSTPMLFMFFGAPFLGDLSDRIGRKKVLLMALTGITVSCLLSAFAVAIYSVSLLILGRAILGFMDGNEAIAQAAIADISIGKNKVLYMSFISLSGTVGFVIGPMLGGLFSDHHLVSWFNYTTPFIVAALLATLNGIGLHFSFNDTRPINSHKKIEWLRSFHSIAFAVKDQRIRLLAWIFFCKQFAWGLYFQSVSLLLVEKYHYTPQKVGFFLTFLALCFVLTLSVIIRILLKYLERHTLVMIGMPLIVFGGLLIGFIHKELFVWLSVIPITIGIGISYNTLLSLFSDAVDKDSQGRTMGIATALVAVGWISSALLGGYISSINISSPYWVVSLVALIAIPLLFIYRSRTHFERLI